MSVLQPNGDVVDIGGCRPARDWQDGDVLGAPWVVPGSPCLDRPYGFAYGNIVTDLGNNNGVINAGDAAAALPATYQEVVVLGEIRHAIHVYGGCFTGGRYPGTYAGECPDRGGIPVGAHLYLDMTRAEIDATPTSIIPAHMRVFAYAAHEHGMFALDTGDGTKWISSGFLIEDALPALQSGAITQSYWWDWFVAHGGAMTADKNLKLQTPIDWSQLASRMYVLQECYARGTCRDSIPETPVMTRLQMGQQPTKTAPGQVITPAVTVQVLNQNGQPYTTTPQPSVTVALGTSPSGGTLSGTRTQTAIGGVATFADLRVDLAGNGYTLVVSAGSGVTGATSVPFAITGQSQ
jgi:hypothetical protein